MKDNKQEVEDIIEEYNFIKETISESNDKKEIAKLKDKLKKIEKHLRALGCNMR